MKKEIIEKFARKINTNCCEHGSKRYKYIFGYIGAKFCKVSMCLDCDKVQYLGKGVFKPFFPFMRWFNKNRIEMIETIEFEPTFDENAFEMLKKHFPGAVKTYQICELYKKIVPAECCRLYCKECAEKQTKIDSMIDIDNAIRDAIDKKYNEVEAENGNKTKSEN